MPIKMDNINFIADTPLICPPPPHSDGSSKRLMLPKLTGDLNALCLCQTHSSA